MSNTLLNKNQAGDGIWTQDNLVAGKNIQFVQATNPYVIDQYTVACWHFNESLVDEVASNTLSKYPTSTTMQVSYSTQSGYPSSFGKALVTSAAANAGDDWKFALSTPIEINGAFTIDYWAKYVAGSGNSSNRLLSFFEKIGSYSMPAGKRLAIHENSLKYHNSDDTWGGVEIVNSSDTLLPEAITHFAFTFDENGIGRYFKNGVLTNTVDCSSVFGGIKISYIYSSANYSTYETKQAAFDELRISNVCRWTEDFEVPSGPYKPDTGESWYEVTASGLQKDITTAITGYDATKTQVLKNVNGTLTWVDEA